MSKKIERLGCRAGKARKREQVAIISELRQKYPLALLLIIANLPRSSYYYHLKHLCEPQKHLKERDVIQQVCVENKGRYGYRRVTLELRRRGFQTNHKLVMKLMKQEHLTCMLREKKYRSYRGEVGKISPNLLQRDFRAERPNLKWTTDITEFKLFGQKLYLSPIMDLFNGEIVSYSLSKSPSFHQVTKMLKDAFQKIPDNSQLILHSDQGWQYQMKIYQKMLKDKGIRQSMSRKGNCYDNSVMENFFGILKSEFYRNQKFSSTEHFEKELSEYIDYYNNRRIKVKLKGLSPVQFRSQSLFLT
ncbi:MAG: IS3 family transposase [Anaerolineaceae bacterium]